MIHIDRSMTCDGGCLEEGVPLQSVADTHRTFDACRDQGCLRCAEARAARAVDLLL